MKLAAATTPRPDWLSAAVLREEFDRGVDVQLDEEQSVHDVAALLKEFLRDLPDPLLTKELYTSFINTTLLDPDEKQTVTQLLVYLLPACNSDTLHRLLEFLSTVADHAHDQLDKDGQEKTGNKMTPLNLATIFGPNLLHKQKNSDKEFSVQSSARAEESTAVIGVLQTMISACHHLFMRLRQSRPAARCRPTTTTRPSNERARGGPTAGPPLSPCLLPEPYPPGRLGGGGGGGAVGSTAAAATTDPRGSQGSKGPAAWLTPTPGRQSLDVADLNDRLGTS
ncbi:hypothetical protein CRUP_021980 [Coryphaenoides rupestris]|nr:hypothetical protein CRUP_021980 [Coryphaenoides rupestris]